MGDVKRYRVQVHVSGVVIVEAGSSEEAEALASQAEPTLSGKRLFDRKLYVETLGEQEHTVLQPDNVRQVHRASDA